VFTGENVPCPTHVGGKLIQIVYIRDDCVGHTLLSKVANYEFISLRGPELGKFQVDSSNPEAFAFQAVNQMSSNKPTSTAYQYSTF